MGFDVKGRAWGVSAGANWAEKEAPVRAGQAHAAPVDDGGACLGRCQFGACLELPRIKHLKAYREGLTVLPDRRIACFFAGRAVRGHAMPGDFPEQSAPHRAPCSGCGLA